jgi:hypothetical protein
MSVRALGLILLALVGILVIPIAACSSGGKSDLAANVDWRKMTPIPRIEADGTRTITDVSELQQQVGFALLLPSYLPSGMSPVYAASQPPTLPDGTQIVQASVSFFPAYRDVRHGQWFTIDLTEAKREVGELGEEVGPREGDPEIPGALSQPGVGRFLISDIVVDCDLTPSEDYLTPAPTDPPEIATRIAHMLENAPPLPTLPTHPPSTPLSPDWATALAGATSLPVELTPRLSCEWQTDELAVDVEFRWELRTPIAGVITSEMRDEAMKVVTSMIEDPYVP